MRVDNQLGAYTVTTRKWWHGQANRSPADPTRLGQRRHSKRAQPPRGLNCTRMPARGGGGGHGPRATRSPPQVRASTTAPMRNGLRTTSRQTPDPRPVHNQGARPADRRAVLAVCTCLRLLDGRSLGNTIACISGAPAPSAARDFPSSGPTGGIICQRIVAAGTGAVRQAGEGCGSPSTRSRPLAVEAGAQAPGPHDGEPYVPPALRLSPSRSTACAGLGRMPPALCAEHQSSSTRTSAGAASTLTSSARRGQSTRVPTGTPCS